MMLSCAPRRANKGVPQKVKAYVQLTDVDGSEPTAPADTVKAISRDFKAHYGDTGEEAHLSPQETSSEVMARKASLVITDEAIQRAVDMLSRRKGTVPGPGGIP